MSLHAGNETSVMRLHAPPHMIHDTRPPFRQARQVRAAACAAVNGVVWLGS
ncbi:MAG: hypothetical protein ABSB15_01525 [Bryobacteraceae bacterium]